MGFQNLRNPPDLIKRIGDAIIIVKSYGPLEPVQMVFIVILKCVFGINSLLGRSTRSYANEGFMGHFSAHDGQLVFPSLSSQF